MVGREKSGVWQTRQEGSVVPEGREASPCGVSCPKSLSCSVLSVQVVVAGLFHPTHPGVGSAGQVVGVVSQWWWQVGGSSVPPLSHPPTTHHPNSCRWCALPAGMCVAGGSVRQAGRQVWQAGVQPSRKVAGRQAVHAKR